MNSELQIERMQENIEQLTEDLGEVKGVMYQVKDAIMGNPLTNDGGIAARLSKLEKKVESYEKLRWIIVGVAVTSGLALDNLFEIILKLFK